MSDPGAGVASTALLPDPAPPAKGGSASAGTTRKYLRGSSLLMGGRFVSLALNLAVQVLTVRYLSKHDYGAFAYALALVSIGASAVLMGLDKAIARFLPLYQERGEQTKIVGGVLMAAAAVWGLGLSLTLLLHGFQGVVADTLVHDPLALALLLILVVLSPVDAFDHLMQSVAAVFVRPRAIFFRRHVLGPGLKLAAVLAVIAVGGSVHLLAYGYLLGGVLGSVTYVWVLKREWDRLGLLRGLSPRTLRMPVREVFGYSLPLLSSELTFALRGSLAVVLLGYFQPATEVAAYKAVLPLAKLNQVVLQSFSILFIPMASRLFAREERREMNELYWQTALWTSVISFPVFAVTFALAGPLTTLLFGPQYADSAALLALLAFGNYFAAALGFNAYTLRVHGKVRYLVTIDVATALFGFAISLLLVPRLGALGAAIGTAATFVVHGVLSQVGLLVGGTGVTLFEWRYLRVYLVIALVTLALVLVQRLASPPEAVSLLLVAVGSLAVIRFTRHVIDPAATFPELLRVPLLRRLLR